MGGVKRYKYEEDYDTGPSLFCEPADLVAMDGQIFVLASDFDAALAREAAERLRGDVAVADANDAERREAELREELADEKTGAAGIYQQLEICRKQLESAKEELEGTKYMRRKFRQDRDDLQQRLTAAEQRNATLEAELEVEKINAAHWKSTIAGEGQISKEARRYRGIRDILPLNELIEATADCQSSAEWDNAVDAALKPTESGASE